MNDSMSIENPDEDAVCGFHTDAYTVTELPSEDTLYFGRIIQLPNPGYEIAYEVEVIESTIRVEIDAENTSDELTAHPSVIQPQPFGLQIRVSEGG